MQALYTISSQRCLRLFRRTDSHFSLAAFLRASPTLHHNTHPDPDPDPDPLCTDERLCHAKTGGCCPFNIIPPTQDRHCKDATAEYLTCRALSVAGNISRATLIFRAAVSRWVSFEFHYRSRLRLDLTPSLPK